MSNSYEHRPVASPKNHQVYNTFLRQLGLNPGDEISLRDRGLTPQQIIKMQYASKVGHSHNALIGAMAVLSKNHDLKDVPGFFKHESGAYTCAPATGLMIPVRDYNGNIVSLIIRNSKATADEKTGKIKGKYISFSSGGKPEGAKVFQTTHCPIIRGPANDWPEGTVRITEGILKADVAMALDEKVPCLGMHGLNLPKDLRAVLEKLDIQEVYIALDSGEDKSPDMLRAKVELIKLCEDMEIDYKVELWDEKHGKGIDDVLKNGHKTRFATQEEIDDLKAHAHYMNPWNGEWCYIIQQERFFHKLSGQNWSKAQFAARFAIPKLQSVNEMLADDYEIYDHLTYEPGKDLILKDRNGTYFNTWRDPEIEAAEGDISLLAQHMEYLFSDEKDRDIVLDFLAFILQFPGQKIRWALIIQGSHFGTGKSFLAEMMKVLLGDFNVTSPSMEEIQGKFTHWQKNCQLIAIEELMALGRRELVNKLKPMIVSPTARIREMHKTEYNQPNRYNILCFTNHRDPIPLEEGDRRYAVIKTDAVPKDKAYYDALFGWLEKPETAQHLLHYFLHQRDLSNMNHSRAPMTQAKQDIIEMSLHPLEAWIKSGMEERCWPFNGEILAIRHLKDRNICPQEFHKIPDQKWADYLRKYGAIAYDKQVLLSGGGRIKVWLIGDNKHLLMNFNPPELAIRYEHPQTTKPAPKSSNDGDPDNKILELKEDTSIDLLDSQTPLAGTNDQINPVKDAEPL